jgi:ABC-type sugar transport system ATPase subunit
VKPEPAGEFSGQVTLTEPLGVETILHIQSRQRTLLSLVPGMIDVNIGDMLRFNIVHDRIHCFSSDGKRVQA